MRYLTIVLVAFILLLNGCNTEAGKSDNADLTKSKGKETEEKEDSSATEEKSKSSNEGYTFDIEGVSIAMHAEASPILEKLGEPHNYFVAESCAFPGEEKTYTFNGFDLYTYEKDGVDYVAALVLLDDTVSTKEGLSLFATKDDVIHLYGNDFTKKLDLYTYQENRSQLAILIEGNEVTSIEYLGTVD